MYQPPHFSEDSSVAMQGLIRAFPLGLLITNGVSGLAANAIPFSLDPEAGEHGVLRCHVARANTQWQDIGQEIGQDIGKETANGLDVLVVFQGAQHYVHPGWYETKRETGKVVPTWNYAMVQVKGRARVMDDHAWLARQIRDLTDMMEGSYPKPWAVDDAPEPFIEAQMRGIVGIEIAITTMHGKWKVSQNRNDADVEGVIEGLQALQVDDAKAMAELVEAGLEQKRNKAHS